jgi:hypothetical protein
MLPTLSRTCSWKCCAPRVAWTQAGDMPWLGCMDWGATSRRPCTASRRALRAEQQLQGHALLDADDYARVEERVDAAADLRRTYTAMQRLTQQDRQVLELVAVDGLSAVEAARALLSRWWPC